MFPSPSSPNPNAGGNDKALRQALHSSLQEALMDVASDVHHMGGGVSTAGLSQQQMAGLYGSSDYTGGSSYGVPGMPPLPSYLRGNMFSGSPQGLDPLQGMSSQQQQQQAHNPNMLTHARAALLKQQLIADERKRQLILEEKKKLFLQDSYMALLREQSAAKLKSGNTTAGASPPMALDLLLAARGGAQHPSMSSASQQQMHQVHQAQLLAGQPHATAAPVPKQAPNALEALGSSLRNKNDPYIDVSSLRDPDPKDTTVRRTRGGVSTPFPEKLHEMLMDVEKEGKTDIVSFYSHGRAFGVHDPDRFVSEIMPKYFKQSKWNSFARQLNLYGFLRIQSGPDAGGYYHELFLQGRPNLCFHMRRVGVPQGGDRRKLKTKQEAPDPDFYSMKPVTSTAAPSAAAAPSTSH